ncbi:hypothetical protein [Dyella japonica]|uniref:Uncharacterized protein n=1 Tax=Dyella japonica TaxID=231455 RepID=A0ABV2JZ13_9GAMM
MNALPCFAERAAHEYQRIQDLADHQERAELDALEHMRGDLRSVDDFLIDTRESPDLTGLIALFLDYGLPLRSKTPSDDKLLTKYEDRREVLIAQFDAWARKRSPLTDSSPLYRWMELRHDV